MPEDKPIEEALRRLENCCIQVFIRGGKIVKIPAQRIEMQLRDGVQDIKVIHSDIIDE
jgi:hypothetical protein